MRRLCDKGTESARLLGNAQLADMAGASFVDTCEEDALLTASRFIAEAVSSPELAAEAETLSGDATGYVKRVLAKQDAIFGLADKGPSVEAYFTVLANAVGKLDGGEAVLGAQPRRRPAKSCITSLASAVRASRRRRRVPVQRRRSSDAPPWAQRRLRTVWARLTMWSTQRCASACFFHSSTPLPQAPASAA